MERIRHRYFPHRASPPLRGRIARFASAYRSRERDTAAVPPTTTTTTRCRGELGPGGTLQTKTPAPVATMSKLERDTWFISDAFLIGCAVGRFPAQRCPDQRVCFGSIWRFGAHLVSACAAKRVHRAVLSVSFYDTLNRGCDCTLCLAGFL